MKNSNLPHSAISSWGGFLYQGKVALYHAITLLNNPFYYTNKIESFEILLDSTDDFAIYSENKAISTHQVKALKDQYRSAYIEALQKAAIVNKDCDENTKRFFHVAQILDDSSDYQHENNCVEFYKYDEEKHCHLSDIEEKIKNLIRNYFDKKNLLHTEILILEKTYILSELITKKIISNHNEIHLGRKQNEVAYNERISSTKLEDILLQPPVYLLDKERICIETKNSFCYVIENYLYDFSSQFSADETNILSQILKCLSSLEISEILNINSTMQPHLADYSLNHDDVRNYLDVFLEIGNLPILLNTPHYKCIKGNKYLPTALSVKTQRARATIFLEELLRNIKNNANLSSLLYEYNNLIAHSIENNISLIMDDNKITSTTNNDKYNITKPYNIRVLTTEMTSEEIYAK